MTGHRTDHASARNLEGLEEFAVDWRWAGGKVRPGFTAVLRVKDEARSLPWVLPGLLRAVDQILVIDNGSTDGTPDVARDVARGAGADERLEVTSYPFAVSRCGSEHLATPPDSVHSLTYFYNWSFSQVETAYALKWDGDMILTEEGEQVFRDLAWQLEATDAVLRIPRVSLYLESDAVAYVDTDLRNREPWGWPNRPGYRFGKAFEWELPLRPGTASSMLLPQFICFELKWLDADEFSHWSPHEFEQSIRTRRKHREMEVFDALARGDVPEGLLRVDRDGDDHVIDTIRRRSTAQWAATAQVA